MTLAWNRFAFVSALAVFVCRFSWAQNSNNTAPELWFDQKLDHFDATDQRFWKQRYYVNDTYYKPGGPAFLFIGAEGPLSPLFVQGSSMIDNARTYSAIAFALEHRFYGKSRPTANLSTENLHYLSVEQALSDLANFIVHMNSEHNIASRKWVTFGGSYSGMLSAYMRLKFPHLVAGAIAGSAPVAAPIGSKGFITGAKEVLESVHGCYDKVKTGFDDIWAHLKTASLTKQVQSLFRFCPFDHTNHLDVNQAMVELTRPILFTIQYSDLPLGRKRPLPSFRDMCAILNRNNQARPIERIAEVNRIYWSNYTNLNGSCTDVTFASRLVVGRDVDFSKQENIFLARQWVYQLCSEVGLYVTAMGPNQPFGNAITDEYYMKICQGFFGPGFNGTLLQRGHAQLLTDYGGMSIPATNVVYTQGTLDPWHTMGFTRSAPHGSHVIIIPNMGHTPTVLAASSRDSPALTRARTRISHYIGQWIKS